MTDPKPSPMSSRVGEAIREARRTGKAQPVTRADGSVVGWICSPSNDLHKTPELRRTVWGPDRA